MGHRVTRKAMVVFASFLSMLFLIPSGKADPLMDPEEVLDAPFTVAILGDTQSYVACNSWAAAVGGRTKYSFFTEQTQWLADNAENLNLKLVIQVGDIVNNGDYTWERSINCDTNTSKYSFDLCRTVSPTWCEWHRAKLAMDTIKNAGIPYLITPGNHDDGDGSIRGQWEIFNQFFGADYYAGQSWFLGTDTGVNYSHFAAAIKIPASGREWLVLALYGAQQSGPRPWLDAQIDAHPGVPTIISTHKGINGYQRIVNGPHRWFSCPLMEAWGFDDGQCDDAGTMFTVEPSLARHPEVFLISAGHVATGHTYHLIQQHAVSGEDVIGVLSDYSADTEDAYWPVNGNGGGGMINLLQIDPGNNQVCMQAMTAAFDGPHYIDDPATVPWCESLDFQPRFFPVKVPSIRYWGAVLLACILTLILGLEYRRSAGQP